MKKNTAPHSRWLAALGVLHPLLTALTVAMPAAHAESTPLATGSNYSGSPPSVGIPFRARAAMPFETSDDAASAPIREQGTAPGPSQTKLRFVAAAEAGTSDYRLGSELGAPRSLAQFQLSPTPEGGAPPRPVVQFLRFQYGYGSESKIEYRRDRDLDRRIPDNNLIVSPQVNAAVLYRPTSWLETVVEMILEKDIPVNEKHTVTLPSGDVQLAPKRRASFLVDQAYVRVHNITAPFEFSVGRKNYEDERHWLYDTSMDVVSTGLRMGRFRADLTVGREVYKDLDFAPSKREVKDRVDTQMLYADYRLEDARLAAYTIRRDDRARLEGRAHLIGARITGSPSDSFNYWTDVAVLRGTDESSRKLKGHGFDAGFTYRFIATPLQPTLSLGYAFGSGDGNPTDQRNGEFRQSGLHSNEMRLAGVPKFKIYGEALDPELSNIKILTLGVGFRPAANTSVEFVYHRYRLHRIADQFRASALTAEINQIDDRMSKDMGDALDVVVGFRRLFGLRLGLDLRAGVFFPGKAFYTNEGTNNSPVIRHGSKGFSFVGKIWW